MRAQNDVTEPSPLTLEFKTVSLNIGLHKKVSKYLVPRQWNIERCIDTQFLNSGLQKGGLVLNPRNTGLQKGVLELSS